ncbi:hypothetical protein, partial [Undibacterium sp. CCC3.4]|uniref:hypothetical protein n=1 Tax=Undibacterium sp. CCC3.4 TaxID=3048609 RepID=UPI002B23C6A4
RTPLDSCQKRAGTTLRAVGVMMQTENPFATASEGRGFTRKSDKSHQRLAKQPLPLPRTAVHSKSAAMNSADQGRHMPIGTDTR